MRIPKDGILNSFDLASLRIMDEFSFDMEAMSDEIIKLREETKEKDGTIDNLQQELERANDAVSNHG